jgi:hypothetical protein
MSVYLVKGNCHRTKTQKGKAGGVMTRKPSLSNKVCPGIANTCLISPERVLLACASPWFNYTSA